MKKIALLGITVFMLLISGALYLRWFGGRLLESEPSTNGETIAEVRNNASLSALDSDYLSVRLRSSRFAMPQEVFGATNYKGALRLNWIDPSHLVVTIIHPGELQVMRKEKAWRNVTLSYEENQ